MIDDVRGNAAPDAGGAGAAPPPVARAAGSDAAASALAAYVPTLVRQWVSERPSDTHTAVPGTLAFFDISGFTRLSERLARLGQVGAEELTDTIDRCFTSLLRVGYDAGGRLIKFGGDALLILFTGEDHAARAAGAAVSMRRALGKVGRVQTPGGPVRVRMSAGLHSGEFNFFLTGESHRELMIAGQAASDTVRMESAASAGEVLVSQATAALLPPTVLAGAHGPGYLLRRAPAGSFPVPDTPDVPLDEASLLACLPVAVREQLRAGLHEPEHRRVTVAFVHYSGTDALVRAEGAQAAAGHLDALVRDVQEAADRHSVAFLATDIDHDGGKVLLAAGAPVAGGNDDERMLLALRQIVDGDRALATRAGVTRGAVFAGDVGPPYRRTYTVMGDAVNLAARLMARAEPGRIFASPAVVEQSRTVFGTESLAPFAVKGKSRPVRAYAVGAVAGERKDDVAARMPLVGRERELSELCSALASVRAGSGRLVELLGEPGLGKSRLVDELRLRAEGPVVALACELYESSTPYFPLREPVRALLGVGVDAGDADVAARLAEVLAERAPELLPWAPLLGILLDVDLPSTAETDQLDARFRRPRLHQVAFRLLSSLLPGPTLVTVEDAHLMDEASADLLGYVARRLGEVPWLVCVARRDIDRGFVAPDVEHASALRLAPLEGAAASALAGLVTEAAPLPAHETALLVERSGGNPLFLVELVAAARAAGSLEGLPDTVEALITARIDRLPPSDRMALRYLAVLGNTFRRHLAEAVLPPDDTVSCGRRLHRLAEFLEQQDDGHVRFTHTLVRDAAYEGLSYRLRRRLHAEVGDTIERTGADADSAAEPLSFHFFHAQRYPEAWRYSLVAAESARAIYANVAAAQFYERALEAAKRVPDLAPLEIPRVQEALGDVRGRTGAFAAAGTAYRAARRLVGADAVTDARLLLRIAETQGWLRRYSQALRSIRRALRGLEGIESVDAARQRAQLMVWYARFCQEEGRHSAAIKWSEEAIETGRAAGERDALAHAYRLLDWAYMDLGHIDRAVHSPKALAIYEELGDLSGQAAVLNNMGGIAYWQGRWGDALESYQRSLDLCTRTGEEVGVAFARANIGEILADQGRLDEAEVLFRDALRVWQAAGHRSRIASAQRDLARVASRLHRHDEAMRLLGEVRAEFTDVGARVDVLETEARMAESFVFQGEPRAALQLLDEALGRARTLGGVAAQSPMLHRVRGYALLQLREFAGAAGAFEESLAAGCQREADYEVALTLRGFGDLAAVTGAPPPQDAAAQSHAILERLGVVRVPAVPLPPSAAPPPAAAPIPVAPAVAAPPVAVVP